MKTDSIPTKKILLVEDDPKDVELTLVALSNNNMANGVEVVRDGAEALDYLFQRGDYVDRQIEQPILILLDLKMPKVDGFEVLRQIKIDPVLKTIPVVVLTSSKEEQDIIDSYNLGVNAYVVKPVAFDEFIKAVKRLGLFWILVNEQPPGAGEV
ncbi:MAG: response regulator [Chloroflexi bacterium]|nr:response regulator [Chloroflexota bacterium]